MYDIYIISFQLLWETLYPPILRKPKHLSWGKVMAKPLQYLRDLIFDDYANGSNYLLYDNSTVYVLGDRIFYLDRGVYECILATLGNLPTDATYWRKINDNYIGVRERILYNSQKMTFEWALNRWFICSGIYIENQSLSFSGFLMGNSGEYSSTLVNISNPSYLMNSFTISTDFSFIIYVPLAVFNSLGNSDIERENIIRSFADNYVLAGMLYDVLPY